MPSGRERAVEFSRAVIWLRFIHLAGRLPRLTVLLEIRSARRIQRTAAYNVNRFVTRYPKASASSLPP